MLALCEPAKESLLKARQPTSGQCSAHARTSTSGSNVQTTMQPPEDLDFLSELPGLPVVAGDKSLPQFPLPPQRPVRINNTDDRWEDDSCPPASLELAQEDAGAGRCKPKQGRFRQRNAAHGSGPHRAATERVSLERLREVFTKPRSVAARELGISTNCLKRVCRDKGIERWPHRKIISLDHLEESCRAGMGLCLAEGEQQDLLRAIAEERARLIQDPNRPVDKNLVQRRLASYKKRYAIRRREGGVPARPPKPQGAATSVKIASRGAGSARGRGSQAGSIASDSEDDLSAGELSGEDEGSESEEEEQEERRQLRQGSTVGRRASVQGEAGAGLGAVLVAAGGAARTGTKRVSGTQAQNACGMGAAAATENNMAVDVVQPMSKSQLKNKVECKAADNLTAPSRSSTPEHKRQEVAAGSAASCPHSPHHTQPPMRTISAVDDTVQTRARRVISGVALVSAHSQRQPATVVSAGGVFCPAPAEERLLAAAGNHAGGPSSCEPAINQSSGGRCNAGLPQLQGCGAVGRSTPSPSPPPSPGLKLKMEVTMSTARCSASGERSPSLPAEPMPTQATEDSHTASHGGRLVRMSSVGGPDAGNASVRSSPLHSPPHGWHGASGTIGGFQLQQQQAGVLSGSQPQGQQAGGLDGNSFPGFHSSPTSYDHQPYQYGQSAPTAPALLQQLQAARASQLWEAGPAAPGAGWNSSGAGDGGAAGGVRAHSSPLPKLGHRNQNMMMDSLLTGAGDDQDDFSFLDDAPAHGLDDTRPLNIPVSAFTSSPRMGNDAVRSVPTGSGAHRLAAGSGPLTAGHHAFLSTQSSVGSCQLTTAEFLSLPLSQLPQISQHSFQPAPQRPAPQGVDPRMLHSAPPIGVQYPAGMPAWPQQLAAFGAPLGGPSLSDAGCFLDGGAFLDGGDHLVAGSASGPVPGVGSQCGLPASHVRSEPLQFVSLDSYGRTGSGSLQSMPARVSMPGHTSPSVGVQAGNHPSGSGSSSGLAFGNSHVQGMAGVLHQQHLLQQGQRRSLPSQHDPMNNAGPSSSLNATNAIFSAGLGDSRARAGYLAPVAGGAHHGPAAAGALLRAGSLQSPTALPHEGIQLLQRAITSGPSTTRAAAARRAGSISPPAAQHGTAPGLGSTGMAAPSAGSFWMGMQTSPNGGMASSGGGSGASQTSAMPHSNVQLRASHNQQQHLPQQPAFPACWQHPNSSPAAAPSSNAGTSALDMMMQGRRDVMQASGTVQLGPAIHSGGQGQEPNAMQAFLLSYGDDHGMGVGGGADDADLLLASMQDPALLASFTELGHLTDMMSPCDMLASFEKHD